MASTYFFPRQDHPITGRTSQTRLECFVSQGLKLTRLVRTSLTLEILALNCKLNTEESTGFPLTIMHIQGSLRIKCLFLILLQKRMPQLLLKTHLTRKETRQFILFIFFFAHFSLLFCVFFLSEHNTCAGNWIGLGSMPPRYSKTRWRMMFILVFTTARSRLTSAQAQEEHIVISVVPVSHHFSLFLVSLCSCLRCMRSRYGYSFASAYVVV